VILQGNAEDPKKAKPLTLRAVACMALTGHHPQENIDGLEKVRRFTLAQRIHVQDLVEMTVEEVALVKLLINQTYGTVVVAPAWALLDPPSAPPAPKEKPGAGSHAATEPQGP